MMPSAKERTNDMIPLAHGVREGMGLELLPTILISLDSRASLGPETSTFQLPDCTIGTDRFHTEAVLAT